MADILDFNKAHLARVERKAQTHDYALSEVTGGWELRCPFNGRPQFRGDSLGEIERFLDQNQIVPTTGFETVPS